jgi:hypothetical protein
VSQRLCCAASPWAAAVLPFIRGAPNRRRWCRRWSRRPSGRAAPTSHSVQRRRGTDRQGADRQCSSGGLLDTAGAVEQGEIDIDPDDDKLAAQLGSIKWGIDSRGRIKIESKDDMRKRGLPSPDRADAMAIAFAGKANAAPMNFESHAGESITGDLMRQGVVTVR